MICAKGVEIEFIYNKLVESKLWQKAPEEASGSRGMHRTSWSVTFLIQSA